MRDVLEKITQTMYNWMAQNYSILILNENRFDKKLKRECTNKIAVKKMFVTFMENSVESKFAYVF